MVNINLLGVQFDVGLLANQHQKGSTATFYSYITVAVYIFVLSNITNPVYPRFSCRIKKAKHLQIFDLWVIL